MENILNWIGILHDANDIVELRSFEPKPVLSGYFRAGDVGTIRAQLDRFPNRTFFQTMNPVKADCYSREQHDVIKTNPKESTSDGNIIGRRWILIDCDPVRASGTSSTDAEKHEARIVAATVYRYLRKCGFAEPVVCDSGNGYHLLYQVRLASSDADTVKQFLQAMDMAFSTDAMKIDTAVYNAARVTKLYGTIARKGADTKERPYRASAVIKIPEEIGLTAGSLIQSVSREILPMQVHDRRRGVAAMSESFDLDGFLAQHCHVKKKVEVANGRRYVLEECPFDPSHKDAAVFQLSNGALGFKCFHNSCSEMHWHEFRERLDPEAYSARAGTSTGVSPQRDMKSLHSSAIADLREETKPEGAIMLDIAEIPDEVRTPQTVIKSGIGLLDEKIGGFNLGEVTVWSGGNGAGKSSLVGQIALNAVDNGHRMVIFSGELKPQRVKEWLYRQAAGPDHVHVDPLHPNSYVLNKGVRDELDQILKGKIGIYNNEFGNGWEQVIQRAIIPYVQERKADVVIIDNLMALDIPLRATNSIEAQSQSIKAFSGMAKKMGVHIHFICHPRKSQSFLRKEDISGSADLTNQADNVIMIHRCGADFFARCKEFYRERTPAESDGYGNVLEIMKNRENGVQDELIPLYFETSSKTMSDARGGRMKFGWLEELDLIERGGCSFGTD